MESYLREKKEAILEDRKMEQQNGIKIVGGGEIDEDQKSCLQQVQEKYANFRDDA